MSHAGDSERMDSGRTDPGRGISDRSHAFGPLEVLDSPERVRLDLEIAGPMSRAFAFSIDYSLVLLLILLGVLLVVSGSQQLISWFSEVAFVKDAVERVTAWLSDPNAGEGDLMTRGVVLTFGLWMLLDLTLTTIYFLFFETVFRGRTPGKQMTHLRVVSTDGAQIDWTASLLRNLMRMVDSLPTGYLLGAVAMMISPRVQRLGDVVAGTIVIRERASMGRERMEDAVIAPEVEAGFRFTGAELAAVGEVERRLIRRTLQRAETLSDRAARSILDRTTRAIFRSIGRLEPVEPGLQRDFLLALLQASERLH
jgi:uncharacterized RDD family membrane protein YckC